MDGTAHDSNIEATVWAHLLTLSLTGSPPLYGLEDPHLTDAALPFIRVSFEAGEGEHSGRYAAGAQVMKTPLLVSFDLFWASGDQSSSGSGRPIRTAAAELADGMRQLTIEILDYVTAPATPSPLSPAAFLTFDKPISARALPAQTGILRRQVQAAGWWYLRHTI